VEQDRRTISLGWVVLVGAGLVWFCGWVIGGRFWLTPTNFAITALIFLAAIGWLQRFAVARSIAEARHSGAFEFLLTTPLTAEEIVDDQIKGTGINSRFCDGP